MNRPRTRSYVTPEERKQVLKVLNGALRRDPEERPAFLEDACAGKPQLRAEVEALLETYATRHAPEAVELEAAPSPSARSELSGRSVGPYIIRHEIGRGGMGVVYLADDTRLSRRVALKALAPGVGSDQAHRDRLKQEARAAAALVHKGIATVYALEEFDGDLYIACEYVPGQTLRAVLEGQLLPITDVVDVALDVARALAAAHALGIVHRDLKPENVIRMPDGGAKILDFGVARVESLTPARLTQPGTVLGTPGYMAPEQVLAQETDFRTDLFSFGVLIYELASGSNPFEAETVTATIARILEIEPSPLSGICPASVPKLDQLVATCLSKDPSRRFKTTQDLVIELEQLKEELKGDLPGRVPKRDSKAAPRPETRSLTARWWWQFHQVVASTLPAAMIYPAWRTRAWLEPPFGVLFLFTVVACAAAAMSLRFNLLFIARNYPAELTGHRARALPWTRACDAGLALALLLAAFGIAGAHPEIAALLVGVAVAVVVASFVIEPTTTRAAFRGRSSAVRPPTRRSASR